MPTPSPPRKSGVSSGRSDTQSAPALPGACSPLIQENEARLSSSSFLRYRLALLWSLELSLRCGRTTCHSHTWDGRGRGEARGRGKERKDGYSADRPAGLRAITRERESCVSGSGKERYDGDERKDIDRFEYICTSSDMHEEIREVRENMCMRGMRHIEDTSIRPCFFVVVAVNTSTLRAAMPAIKSAECFFSKGDLPPYHRVTQTTQ